MRYVLGVAVLGVVVAIAIVATSVLLLRDSESATSQSQAGQESMTCQGYQERDAVGWQTCVDQDGNTTTEQIEPQ
jgi:hypothetical protein